MSNPKSPKKAREGKMIWKMDEEDRQQKISQVDQKLESSKISTFFGVESKDGYH